jgi:GrpB-like predicted nucleotidyltransferase (UPF0157 family)
VRHKFVTLAAPNTRWAEAYLAESARIRSALGRIALDIQHVGSTAIPGIMAKPIIDIAVAVNHFEDGFACVEQMAGIGYDYAGNDIVPGDHIFGRGLQGETRTHLVHIVEHDGTHWRRFILFRDRLRNKPELAQAYEKLKIDLAGAYGDNRAAYTAAKKDFIDQAVATNSTP